VENYVETCAKQNKIAFSIKKYITTGWFFKKGIVIVPPPPLSRQTHLQLKTLKNFLNTWRCLKNDLNMLKIAWNRLKPLTMSLKQLPRLTYIHHRCCFHRKYCSPHRIQSHHQTIRNLLQTLVKFETSSQLRSNELFVSIECRISTFVALVHIKYFFCTSATKVLFLHSKTMTWTFFHI